MNEHPDNPASNKLSNAISDADVLTAVERSGYPLQMVVSRYLRKALDDFNQVKEEWSYVDQDSKETRTIDILAEKPLYDKTDNSNRRIRPALTLLMECKQSDLPYIFFLSEGLWWLPFFPMFCGLFGDAVRVKQNLNTGLGKIVKTPVTTSIPNGLGLDVHGFVRQPPAWSLTLSKCVRKGKEIVLSGSESYLNIVLPLLKAARHYHEIEKPPATAHYFDCHMTLCVAVLSAPMVGVRIEATSQELLLLPWVRVLRHQTEKREHWENIAAIDVVHKDFLPRYVEAHVLPFAGDFATRASEHWELLVNAVP